MKMSIIVTHNGQFHADEVLAYSIIKTIYPDIELIRTRDKCIIELGDIVVDVGRVYDPKNNKFDHHQTECHERFNESAMIDMSSAGMVYKMYGREFIRKISDMEIPESEIEIIYHNIYGKLVMEVDAIDNGYKQCSGRHSYYINTNISSIINKLNGTNIYDGEEQMRRFMHGSEYILMISKIVIEDEITKYMTFKQDYEIIESAFKNRANDQILTINEECPNWSKCIFAYEKNNPYENYKNSVKYIIYPSNREWRVRAISYNFESRKLLKKKEKYSEAIRNKIIFVHPKRFIGASYDKKIAINMAIESLQD